MEVNMMGHFYDDFIVGEKIKHCKAKTIFESDNNLFSLLTMNHHPLHTNIAYAEKNQHKQILVVGTLVFSLAVGLSVDDISGQAIANLRPDMKYLGRDCAVVNLTPKCTLELRHPWDGTAG